MKAMEVKLKHPSVLKGGVGSKKKQCFSKGGEREPDSKSDRGIERTQEGGKQDTDQEIIDKGGGFKQRKKET